VLDEEFQKRQRGRGARQYRYEEPHGFRLMVRRGDTLRSQPVIDDDAQTRPLLLRSELYDVVRYDRRHGDLLVNAKAKADVRAYCILVGQHLFDDRFLFDPYLAPKRYTLEPIREQGLAALTYADIDGIECVRLVLLRLEHPDNGDAKVTLDADDVLASLSLLGGRITDALDLLHAAHDAYVANATLDTPAEAWLQLDIGIVSLAGDRLAEAGRAFQTCRTHLERHRGPEHTDISRPVRGLAMVALRRCDPDEAERLTRLAVALCEGDGAAYIGARAKLVLGIVLLENDRTEEATPVLAQAAEQFAHTVGDRHIRIAELDASLSRIRAETPRRPPRPTGRTAPGPAARGLIRPAVPHPRWLGRGPTRPREARISTDEREARPDRVPALTGSRGRRGGPAHGSGGHAKPLLRRSTARLRRRCSSRSADRPTSRCCSRGATAQRCS